VVEAPTVRGPAPKTAVVRRIDPFLCRGWNHTRRGATGERVGLETSAAIPAVSSHGIRLRNLLHALRQPLRLPASSRACSLAPLLHARPKTLDHPVAAACRWTRRTDNGYPVEPVSHCLSPSPPLRRPGSGLAASHRSSALLVHSSISSLASMPRRLHALRVIMREPPLPHTLP
jgi:hypothetical protein